MRSGLVDSIQVIYNIFDQSAAAKLFPACLERDVAVVVRSPLDEGALTGAIRPETVFADDDFRTTYFRDRRKLDIATRIHSLEGSLKSKGLSSPLSEVALRFCVSHPAVTTAIAGMRRIANVDSNCKAVGAGPYGDEVLDILREHTWSKNFYI